MRFIQSFNRDDNWAVVYNSYNIKNWIPYLVLYHVRSSNIFGLCSFSNLFVTSECLFTYGHDF